MKELYTSDVLNSTTTCSSSNASSSSSIADMEYYEPDVYGQIHPIESPELILVSLRRLEEELQKLPRDMTIYAYEAEWKCPTLVPNDFKIVFLRTDQFQPYLAAERYANYWMKRYTLFGPDRAFLPITIANLTMDEIKLLQYQLINTIPSTNNSNNHHHHHSTTDELNNSTDETRSLFYVDFGKFVKSQMSIEVLLRVVWYMFHTLIDDIDIQQKGIIYIGNAKGHRLSQLPSRSFFKSCTDYTQGCIPLRMSAFHVVNPPTLVKYIFPICSMFFKEHIRQRFMIHSEREDKLTQMFDTSYNIPSHRLPTSMGGTYNMNLQQWINNRHLVEMVPVV
jgi:CRAL/TRIO domain